LPLRQGAGASTAATFDAAGNILTFPHELSGHEGQTRAYNDANEWIGYLDGEGHATGGGNFAYDVIGNPTTWKGNALTFDRNNGLASYTTGQTQQMTAGYRADGLRAWKESDGATAYYLYDGATLLAELDADGTVTSYNTWGPTGLLNRTNLQTNRETWYLFDPLGNVAQRTDVTGKVLSADQYDAWGNLLAGGDAQDPYRYKGQYGYYTDHETELLLCTLRYYDPETGRWLTQDPIGYSGDINLYRYCYNNPISNVDPNGDFSWHDFKVFWHEQITESFEDPYAQAARAKTPEELHTALNRIAANDIANSISPQSNRMYDPDDGINTVDTQFTQPSDNMLRNSMREGALDAALRCNFPEEYPTWIDLRTGERISFPGYGLQKVNDPLTWTLDDTKAYRDEWYRRGYKTPIGGWRLYEIHHIHTREYGGTNEFENCTLVFKCIHKSFNNFWGCIYPKY